MLSGKKNTDNKLVDQILVMPASIYTNKQDTDKIKQYCDDLKKKLSKHDFDFSQIKTLLNKVLGQNKTSSPENIYSTKSQDHTTEVPSNKKAPPLEGGNYMKIGDIWTLKHEIRLPKFFELLTKI